MLLPPTLNLLTHLSGLRLARRCSVRVCSLILRVPAAERWKRPYHCHYPAHANSLSRSSSNRSPSHLLSSLPLPPPQLQTHHHQVHHLHHSLPFLGLAGYQSMIPSISYLLLPGILMVGGGSRWGVPGVVPLGGGLLTSFRLCPVWGWTKSFLLWEGQEKEDDTTTKQTNPYPKSTFVTSSLQSPL